MLTATVNISIYYRFDTGFVKYRCWGFFKMFPPEKFPPLFSVGLSFIPPSMFTRKMLIPGNNLILKS